MYRGCTTQQFVTSKGGSSITNPRIQVDRDAADRSSKNNRCTHARTHDARTHARTGSKNVNESIRRSGDGQEFELEDGMSCRQASETPTTGKQQQ